MTSPNSRTAAQTTVLEIVRVSVNSSRFAIANCDEKAKDFLQNLGFLDIRFENKRTLAASPEKTLRFLLDIDTATKGNQKPVKLIFVNGEVYREVETGRSMYVDQPVNKESEGQVAFLGQGLADWETYCKLPDEKVIAAYRLKVLRSEVLKPKDKVSTRKYAESDDLAPPSDREESVVEEPVADTPSELPPDTKTSKPKAEKVVKPSPPEVTVIEPSFPKPEPAKAPVPEVVHTDPQPLPTPPGIVRHPQVLRVTKKATPARKPEKVKSVAHFLTSLRNDFSSLNDLSYEELEKYAQGQNGGLKAELDFLDRASKRLRDLKFCLRSAQVTSKKKIGI